MAYPDRAAQGCKFRVGMPRSRAGRYPLQYQANSQEGKRAEEPHHLPSAGI